MLDEWRQLTLRLERSLLHLVLLQRERSDKWPDAIVQHEGYGSSRQALQDGLEARLPRQPKLDEMEAMLGGAVLGAQRGQLPGQV